MTIWHQKRFGVCHQYGVPLKVLRKFREAQSQLKN